MRTEEQGECLALLADLDGDKGQKDNQRFRCSLLRNILPKCSQLDIRLPLYASRVQHFV